MEELWRSGEDHDAPDQRHHQPRHQRPGMSFWAQASPRYASAAWRRGCNRGETVSRARADRTLIPALITVGWV